MSTNLELSPEPAWGAVLIEQLRAVGIAIRREFIALVVILFGSGIFFTWFSVTFREYGDFPFQPNQVVAMVLVAVVIPLAVWKSEKPERRTYLWSLPLLRRSGHVAKLVSGWLWTMLAVALVTLWWWAVAVATDSLVWERSIYIARNDLAPGSNLELVGDLASYVYPLPGWLLLVPFGLATVLYLVGSAVVLATNHPFRWALGLWCFALAIGGLNELGQDAELRELREANVDERRILDELLDQDRFLERLLGNEAAYGIENLFDPEISRPEDIPGTIVGPRNVQRGNFSNWLTSIGLWGGLALLAAYAAAARHREP